MGCTQINKLLCNLNIPPFDFKTYQRYEKYVGKCVEEVAKASCDHACRLERKYTLKNLEQMKKLL